MKTKTTPITLPSRTRPVRIENSRVTSVPTNSRYIPIKGDSTEPSHQTMSAGRTPPRCFKCGGLGHFARDCPNTQLLTLTEETPPVYDTEEETPEDIETEVVYPDKGESLLIRRSLHTIPARENDDSRWLRNNIFRT